MARTDGGTPRYGTPAEHGLGLAGLRARISAFLASAAMPVASTYQD